MPLRTFVESVVNAVASIFSRYCWVFVLALVIYVPTLTGTFVWDDEQFIYKNIDIRSFDLSKIFSRNTVGGAGVVSGYYRPVTSLTFALDWLLSQGNPSWFHLMNVFWHLAAGVALVGFLDTIGLPVLIPIIIFLLHPLQTEAVAYISGRGDPLSLFFGFFSMWIFALYVKHPARSTLLIISYAAFAFAILSKESGVVFLGLAAFILIGHWHKRWLSIFGFCMVTIAGILLRLVIVGANFGFHWNPVYGASMRIRLLTFSRVLPEYLRMIFVPFPLHMERFVPLVTSLLSPWPWTSLGIIALILLVGIKLEKIYRRQYWFGVFWFGIFLLPQSGILIPAPALLTEHWLYGSLAGFGLAFDALWHSWGWKPMRYVGLLILCIWLILGFRQSYLWADPIRFYEYTLAFSQTARLHNNLGMHYIESGRFKEAEDQYLLAAGLGDYAQIYYNLGNLYVASNRVSDAIIQYRKALEIDPRFMIAADQLRLLGESSVSGLR